MLPNIDGLALGCVLAILLKMPAFAVDDEVAVVVAAPNWNPGLFIKRVASREIKSPLVSRE